MERKKILSSRYQTALFNTPVQGVMALALSDNAAKRRHNPELRTAYALKNNGPSVPSR